MRSKCPLLVCDTNFLLEVLLEQDGNNASWLLQLGFHIRKDLGRLYGELRAAL